MFLFLFVPRPVCAGLRPYYLFFLRNFFLVFCIIISFDTSEFFSLWDQVDAHLGNKNIVTVFVMRVLFYFYFFFITIHIILVCRCDVHRETEKKKKKEIGYFEVRGLLFYKERKKQQSSLFFYFSM